MKQKLVASSYVPLAQEVALAAYSGNLDDLKKCIANGGGTALMIDDVPIEQPVDEQLLNFDGVVMRELHEPGIALNAGMYWAAYRGHRHIVEYFLETGAYCKMTLGACLFGAVCGGDEKMVKMLVEAGADPSHNDRGIMERAIARSSDGIASYLVEKSGEYSHALACYIKHGKLDKALEMLDHDVDVRKGLDALANRLTDRAMMVASRDQDRHLDMFETLMGYAESKGDDMQDVIAHAVSFSVNHWTSLLAEKLIGNAHFNSHPDKQGMLDRLAERTALSGNQAYEMSYHDHKELVEKMLAMGATQEVVLKAAINATNADIALLASTADARRGKPSMAALVEKRLELWPDNADLLRIKKQVEVQVTIWNELETVLINYYTKDKGPIEGLRHVDNFKGRSCLMMAVMCDGAVDVIETFVNQGATLTQEDLFTKDKNGLTLCDLIAEKGIEPLFIDRRLFAGTQDYQRFWERIEPEVQELHAERHKDVLAAFSAIDALKKLSSSNGAAQKRYKL